MVQSANLWRKKAQEKIRILKDFYPEMEGEERIHIRCKIRKLEVRLHLGPEEAAAFEDQITLERGSDQVVQEIFKIAIPWSTPMQLPCVLLKGLEAKSPRNNDFPEKQP